MNVLFEKNNSMVGGQDISKIIKLIKENNKLQAVKELREMTGMSLKDAKDTVDSLASQEDVMGQMLNSIADDANSASGKVICGMKTSGNDNKLTELTYNEGGGQFVITPEDDEWERITSTYADQIEQMRSDLGKLIEELENNRKSGKKDVFGLHSSAKDSKSSKVIHSKKKIFNLNISNDDSSIVDSNDDLLSGDDSNDELLSRAGSSDKFSSGTNSKSRYSSERRFSDTDPLFDGEIKSSPNDVKKSLLNENSNSRGMLKYYVLVAGIIIAVALYLWVKR